MFEDAGESAKAIDRPEFRRLLQYCRANKGRVHFVVVFNLNRSRNVSQGRQVIRKLLGGTRVTMTLRDDGRCELSGRADYGTLFNGIVVATALASPMPASWNQIAGWLKQIDSLRQAA